MIHYRTTLDDIRETALQGFFVGWKEPLTAAQFYRTLEGSSHLVLACDSEVEQVVGLVNALSDGVTFAFIPMLEVLPAYQGRGIGSELMQRMLALLAEMKCIDLTCDPQLQGFYSRFGMLKSTGMIIRRHRR